LNPDPKVMNLSRYMPGKGPKGQVLHKTVAFGMGKRICVGYQIAEIFMKLSTCFFNQAFEFSAASKECTKKSLKVVHCIDEFWVNLRCRPEFWTQDDILEEYGS